MTLLTVVPFDTPPRLALPTALGFGSARAMYERCPSSILQGLYQVNSLSCNRVLHLERRDITLIWETSCWALSTMQGIRLALGMSHKLVRPRLLNWRVRLHMPVR